MPEFICNRTVVITTKGHSVVLRKGQPSYVPLELVKEAIALGAEPVEGSKDDYLPGDDTPEEQLSAEDRDALVFAAFDQLVAQNNSADFGADGKPSLAAVKALVKFNIVKKDVVVLYQKYRELKAEV